MINSYKYLLCIEIICNLSIYLSKIPFYIIISCHRTLKPSSKHIISSLWIIHRYIMPSIINNNKCQFPTTFNRPKSNITNFPNFQIFISKLIRILIIDIFNPTYSTTSINICIILSLIY